MAEKPASLLTNAQRRRIRDDFADVDGAKRRRDQQRIRERVAAGLADFQLLVDYPDGQLEAAVADVDDAEFARSLVAVAATAARIRDLRDVDAATVDAAARELGVEPGPPFLDGDSGREPPSGATASGEGGPSPWLVRAETLLKVGIAGLLPAALLAWLAPDVAAGPIGGILGATGVLATSAGLAIIALRSVKRDLVPAAAAVANDPGVVVRGPLGAIRRSWDRL